MRNFFVFLNRRASPGKPFGWSDCHRPDTDGAARRAAPSQAVELFSLAGRLRFLCETTFGLTFVTVFGWRAAAFAVTGAVS